MLENNNNNNICKNSVCVCGVVNLRSALSFALHIQQNFSFENDIISTPPVEYRVQYSIVKCCSKSQ